MDSRQTSLPPSTLPGTRVRLVGELDSNAPRFMIHVIYPYRTTFVAFGQTNR